MSTERSRARQPETDSDARAIDELVFECLERIEREGWPVIDELCEAHPDYAAVVRARLEALRACGWLDRELGP